MTKSHKREITGIVVSDKMARTVVVEIVTKKRHPKYKKVIKSTKTYKADTAGKTYAVGQEVTIVESRKMSKDKTWVVVAN